MSQTKQNEEFKRVVIFEQQFGTTFETTLLLSLFIGQKQ